MWKMQVYETLSTPQIVYLIWAAVIGLLAAASPFLLVSSGTWGCWYC